MDNFDLRKYLAEGRLFEGIDQDKEELIKMLSMIDENIELKRNELIKLIQDNQNEETISKFLKFAKSEGAERLINKKVIDFLKSENAQQRFINPKTSATTKSGKPTKTSKVLGFDAKESFEELTADHFKSAGTYKIIKSLVINIAKSNVSNEEKESFVDLLSDPKNLIPGSAFDKPIAKGNVDDFLNPKILSHPLYSEIKEELLNTVGGKATGTGEYFLTIFGENGGIPKEGSSKAQGDVFISGVDIEVKNGNTQSAINAEIAANRHQMDNYNKKWLKEVGFSDEEIEDIFTSKRKSKSKATPVEFGSKELKQKLDTIPNGKEKVKEYLEGLYKVEDNSEVRGLDDSDIEELTNKLYPKIGESSNKELSKLVAPYVFKLYKKNKGFDVYMLIDNQGNFISTNTDILPEDIKIVGWILGKGGNVYPYVAYINVTM